MFKATAQSFFCCFSHQWLVGYSSSSCSKQQRNHHFAASATNGSTTPSLPFTIEQCQQLLVLIPSGNPTTPLAKSCE
jgi:hypothetical protein